KLEVVVDLPMTVTFATGLKFGSAFTGGRFNTDNGGTVGENPVVVTPASNPALRAGSYYIGVAVLSNPAAASGSVTANITTGGPIISASSSSLDFGSVAIGQSKDLSFNVHNSGTGPLTVNSLSSSSGQYGVISPSTPFTVAGSADQPVTMRFQPAATG